VDSEGRVGGRLNIVDVLCIAFVLGLIPLAYSSWLLFHPARPRIDSVERSEITFAEERVAAGQPIRLKVKVRGDHLTPMLRAYIGNVPALGFTFETPQSGDVIIGENVAPGTHDLVLFDGPTEVARVPGAITIGASRGVLIRAVGAFTLLDHESAERLHVGQKFQQNGRLPVEILALGEVIPDRRDLKNPTGAIQAASPDTWAREAIVKMQCDPHPDLASCHISGTNITQPAAVIVLPGSSPPHSLRVQSVVPDQPPTQARIKLRVDGEGPSLGGIRAGDRDMRTPSIDDRAAIVESVAPAAAGAVVVVVRLGLDRTSDGWRYHSQTVVPGGPFTLVTDRYGIRGTVSEISLDGQ
jgi:hypothetical protein